jgi:hypothetical protein
MATQCILAFTAARIAECCSNRRDACRCCHALSLTGQALVKRSPLQLVCCCRCRDVLRDPAVCQHTMRRWPEVHHRRQVDTGQGHCIGILVVCRPAPLNQCKITSCKEDSGKPLHD